MSNSKRFTIIGAGLVAGALLFGANAALAQSAGGNGNGGNGGVSGGASAGTGGGAPVIVCTGCADPNSYIERGGGKAGSAYSGKGGGGGPGKLTSVKPFAPVKPVRPGRPRTPKIEYSETDPCYRTYDYLPNGAVVVYRKCNGVVRPLR